MAAINGSQIWIAEAMQDMEFGEAMRFTGPAQRVRNAVSHFNAGIYKLCRDPKNTGKRFHVCINGEDNWVLRIQ